MTHIGRSAFAHCAALKKLLLPSSVTYIGDNAFLGCSALKQLVIPDSVTRIERASVDVKLDDFSWIRMDLHGFSSIFNDVLKVSEGFRASGGTFGGCSGLTELKLGAQTTRLGRGALTGCSSLTKLDVPSSVTWPSRFYRDPHSLYRVISTNSRYIRTT